MKITTSYKLLYKKPKTNNKMLHEPQIKRKMSISRCCHNANGGITTVAATQVFLVLTLFVIGNLSAWQENVRPKLYVELGEWKQIQEII